MKTKNSIILLFVLLISNYLMAQNSINVSGTLTSSQTVANMQSYNLQGKTVSVSGRADFALNKGFVRILLSDNYGYDLLIYETMPLFANNGVDIFTSKATETVNLPSSFTFTKVRVEIENAQLTNLVINVSDNNDQSPTIIQKVVPADRVSVLNSKLRVNKALWVAGETSVSQMSYEEKKALFGGTVPDLQGAEYYVGGIFELASNNSNPAPSATNFVDKFDWRNRHGINWNTSVKNQNPCGTCWAFGAIGSVEGLVNLYYNQKIDLDLSEQQIISCTGSTCNSGGWSYNALNYIIANGVVNETCFPNGYTNDPPCSNKCNSPAENIKIAGMQIFNPSSYTDPVAELKKLIIKKGILAGRINDWHHAMTLVGFGTVRAGDVVYNGTSGGYYNSITIGVNDPRIGQTYWIFKNSWKDTWGSDGGYLYAICDINQLVNTAIPLSPITRMNHTDAEIVCEDRDGDGYYNWGIGPKPATCINCPDEEDGDDSNPCLGPMDEFGNCRVLGLNLLIRDDFNDNGREPNPSPIRWQSPDIWLTANPQTLEPIPNSELYNYSSCYIAVRIKNISCIASTGKEKLHVYWSKSSVNSKWNASWSGNNFLAHLFGLPTGVEITPTQGYSISSPSNPLNPGNETIWLVPWNLPSNINQYEESLNQFFKVLKFRLNWGFAIMARIDDGNEVYGLPASLLPTTTFAQNSNNVAVDNGSLLLFQRDFSNIMYLEPILNKPFSVSYSQLLKEDNFILNDFAEVYAVLSNDLMEKLNQQESKEIKVIDENTVLLSANSELRFKPLDKEEGGYFIGSEVNFISDKMPELNDFDFDFTFKSDDGTEETMRYTAIRDANVYFKAHAQADLTKVVRCDEEITLTSNVIFDDAIYTWYDEAGNVVGDGYQIKVIPKVSQTYTIEIMKKSDGYKSYDKVSITVVDGMIKSLAPNPASDYVTVNYKLACDISEGKLEVYDAFGRNLAAYPAFNSMESVQIPLSGFVPGTYYVKLIANGSIADSKTFIKQ